MQLNKQDLTDLASRGKDRSINLKTATLLGAIVGLLTPFAMALFFGHGSFSDQIELYGIVGFVFRLFLPVAASGIAGAAVGVAVLLICSSRASMAWRFSIAGALAGSLVTTICASVMLAQAGELFHDNDYFQADWIDVAEDVLWLIVGPAFHGGWIGAVVGLATWFTFARHSVGPLAGACGTAVFAAVLATIAMLIYTSVTSPGSDSHGAGIGPGAGHAIGMFFIHVVIVLPVSVAVGALCGWLLHRR